MEGLKALLRVKRAAEDRALKVFADAKKQYERIRAEERKVASRSVQAKNTLRRIEKRNFGIRRSILYRRYLNALRAHEGRCKERLKNAKQVLDGKRKQFEEAKNNREAVGELIERRKEKERKRGERRKERALEELGVQSWWRNK